MRTRVVESDGRTSQDRWHRRARGFRVQSVRPPLASVCWVQKDGYYVNEGWALARYVLRYTCKPTLEEAKIACHASRNCHAIATQSNVCGGRYRVTHGGPTFLKWGNWAYYNLRSWQLDESCSKKRPPLEEVCWEQKGGHYVKEGHGRAGYTSECFSTFERAKIACHASSDCLAIATQPTSWGPSYCGGQFRVTHGGPTLIFYPSNLVRVWRLDLKCLKKRG